MSQKKDKKMRQFLNREYRDAARKAGEQQINYFKSVLKPRPRWVPKFLWKAMLKCFIRIQ